MKCRNCGRTIEQGPRGWRHKTTGWTACDKGAKDPTIAAPDAQMAAAMASPQHPAEWPAAERDRAIADGYLVPRGAA